MASVVHRKVFNRLKNKSYAVDLVCNTALVRWKDYLFVCHHQRLSTVEAVTFLGELQELGLVEKVNKHNIKLLL